MPKSIIVFLFRINTVIGDASLIKIFLNIQKLNAKFNLKMDRLLTEYQPGLTQQRRTLIILLMEFMLI